MSPWRILQHWAQVYGEVEHRLEVAGAVMELHILHRMSQPELDLLVMQELTDPARSDPQATSDGVAA